MLLGIAITKDILIAGGLALLVLLFFQALQGSRKIKFKGRLHMKVHRYTAYALVAAATFHALAGLAFFGIIRL
jgi:hypothetical protein